MRGGARGGASNNKKPRAAAANSDSDGFQAVTKGKKVSAKAGKAAKEPAPAEPEAVTGGAFGALALEEE